MLIAGMNVPYETARTTLSTYVTIRRRTIREFDAQSRRNGRALDLELVRSTRVVNSRISNAEAEWFVQRASTAPWADLDGITEITQLDAHGPNREWEQVVHFYRHFRDDAPRGIGISKVHKVLHLVANGVFPVLDTRLQRLYRDAATRWDEQSSDRAFRPRAANRNYWMAIRSDIERNAGELAEMRNAVIDDPSVGDLREIVQGMSSLRILDILSWSIGSRTES